MEDQPPPLGNRIALFEIENRILSVPCAERGEIRIFAAVDDLQTQQIPLEPHGDRHTGHLQGNCGNLFNGHGASTPLRYAGHTTRPCKDTVIADGHKIHAASRDNSILLSRPDHCVPPQELR